MFISCALCVCVIALFCVCVKCKNTNEYLAHRIRTMDQQFVAHLSSFCGNLWIDYENLEESEKARYDLENAKYSHFCKVIFSETSYERRDGDPEINELHSIVWKLSVLCDDNSLYDVISLELAKDLNRMCHNLEDKELIHRVYESLVS